MINCPVGTYNPSTGKGNVTTDCLPCPAGYYCLEGSSSSTGACAKGFYCPSPIPNPYSNDPPQIGSYGPKQEQCPEKTYTDVIATQAKADCKICPAGYYCTRASESPTDCPRGYFCVEGVEKPAPCPIGRYGNETNAIALEKCPLCDKGWYCDAPGLLQPRAPCDPGFLCYEGAKESGPTDGVTGEVCPAGGYCTLGSYVAKNCPLGTYSNVTGAVNEYDCFDCDPGYYCSAVSGGAPTGLCWGGYYCTGRAKTPRQNYTLPGYYAPNGSVAPRECEIGTYQPYEAQSDCIVCEQGFYCPSKKMDHRVACPAGKYCGNGSYVPQDCPPGTFSNRTHMVHIDNCTDCPQGYYCQDRGITEPTGQCKAGHICFKNALNDDPVYNDDVSSNKTIVTYGDVCAAGHYCPAGTALMIPCPRGTYNPDRGGISEILACKPCPAGSYCNGTGLSAVTGTCDEGYYCVGKAYLPNPNDNTTGFICPQNHFCVAGSQVPKKCSLGYSANFTGLARCRLCLAGFLCLPGEYPRVCPQGYYCPASTVDIPLTQPKSCPEGTYGGRDGLEKEADCSPCDPGHYCIGVGKTNSTGKIQAGHWSTTGSTTSTPAEDDSLIRGLCPKGYYCPEGSSRPVSCPSGTYGFGWMYKSVEDCNPCIGGKYCPQTNMTDNGPDCYAGYFCSAKSPIPDPVNQTYGSECPTGYYCPLGSAAPIACQEGKYQDEKRQSVCKNCPEGFYCPLNTSNPISCPAGYWCLANQKEPFKNPCPIGTFNNLTERRTAASCIACLPGHYCATPGLSDPTDECDPGWFCLTQSTAAQPAVAAEGGVCVAGKFCPKGSSKQIPCTPGMYCNNNELAEPVGNCSAGHFCLAGSTVSNPTDGVMGNLCPKGSYCDSGSQAGVGCPPGTMLNVTGGKTILDCFNCTKGYYCAGYGNDKPSGPCDPGYYCPSGMSVQNPPQYTCPVGHFCIGNNFEPVRCLSGTYQDQTGENQCKECPKGYFCDNTVAPVVLFTNSKCPEGHYCPPGTKHSTEFRCPIGTYSNYTGLDNVTNCLPCPGGYYCDAEAQTSFSKVCQEGFVRICGFSRVS